MQLHKLEFGQEMFSQKAQQDLRWSELVRTSNVAFSHKNASPFLASSKGCCWQGSCQCSGTREARHQAWHCNILHTGAWQAASCFPLGGLLESQASHGELVQLVTRKAGLLLGEEGLL